LHIDITHVLGVGENTIHDLINNEGNPELKIWWVLILIVVAKTLTTGLTLMAGGSAGLLVPSMVLGGAAGASMFYFISGLELNILASTNPHLFIVSGISAALVAVVQVPVAAVLIVMEMFGANFGPPAMISVVVCHLLVKRLKGYQKTASASEGQENSKEGSESEKDE